MIKEPKPLWVEVAEEALSHLDEAVERKKRGLFNYPGGDKDYAQEKAPWYKELRDAGLSRRGLEDKLFEFYRENPHHRKPGRY